VNLKTESEDDDFVWVVDLNFSLENEAYIEVEESTDLTDIL